jgi:hypothetical protein
LEQVFFHALSRKKADIPPSSEQDESRSFFAAVPGREQKFLQTVSRMRAVISQCSEQD